MQRAKCDRVVGRQMRALKHVRIDRWQVFCNSYETKVRVKYAGVDTKQTDANVV